MPIRKRYKSNIVNNQSVSNIFLVRILFQIPQKHCLFNTNTTDTNKYYAREEHVEHLKNRWFRIKFGCRVY